jgi:hypothetical protein
MPVLLVCAVAGGVSYAAFSTNVPHPQAAAVAAPPLEPVADEDPGDPADPAEPQAPGGDMPPTTDESTLVAVVREHTDVGQYTYVRLALDAGDTWAAVYRAPVTDGKTVTITHAFALHNFHSRELKRDFETIYFGVLPGYETAPAGMTPPPGASGATTGAASAAAVAPAAAAPLNVKAVAGATTIVDLAKNAVSLLGKQVTVVGRVSKENDGIMGRNWIHVVDGTGNAKDGNNDLLVTSPDAKSSVGSDVVVTGTVNTDQDYGSGYAYKFLLENATIAPAPK